jgi:hypothetical protein
VDVTGKKELRAKQFRMVWDLWAVFGPSMFGIVRVALGVGNDLQQPVAGNGTADLPITNRGKWFQ